MQGKQVRFMANSTPPGLRNQVIYSVYVRAHSPEGNFAGVARDLDRIRALGTDIVWLMPIHPIGKARRKGSLGCPYAVRDYRAVNPEYGTLDDLRALLEAIHARGMRCIIDVVYNHTSPDSILARTHPEWFHHGPDGAPAPRIADWSDVVDLDYAHAPLWDYQIDTLKAWAALVDGFRCDVASLVPAAFWRRARAEVEQIRPGCIWLGESVEAAFVKENRDRGVPVWSDGELYTAFDLLYDYDIWAEFDAAAAGRAPLSRWVDAVNRQEWTYPAGYCKLRCLENHDNPRAAHRFPDRAALACWTALQFFLKGTPLIYAGQEASDPRTPSLFEREGVDWSGPDLSPLIRRLAQLKRDPLFADGAFSLTALDSQGAVVGRYAGEGRALTGVFPLRGMCAPLPVPLADGTYEDLIGGAPVTVTGGTLDPRGRPVLISAP